MICSDIWHKQHEWYFKIVIRNLRQFWNITSGIYAKYHVQILLLFVYTTTRKRFVIFTCRYFKLSWNITALSQSNCRNFSCSSIGFVQIFGCKIQDFFPEFFQTQGYQITNKRSLEAKPLDKWRSQGFPAMQCKRTVTIWQCRHGWFGYGRD